MGSDRSSNVAPWESTAGSLIPPPPATPDHETLEGKFHSRFMFVVS